MLDISRPQRGTLGAIALAVYLCLAPVTWLPGILGRILLASKLTLFVGATLLVWTSAFAAGKPVLPRGLFGLGAALCIIIAATPGFLQAQPEALIPRANDFIYAFAMLWTAFVLFRLGCQRTKLALVVATFVVILAMLTTLSSVVPGLNWRGAGGEQVSQVGFSHSRTGWSNGLALFAPYVVTLGLEIPRKMIWKLSLGIILGSVILSAQMTVGGRAGIAASLLSIVILIGFRFRPYLSLTVAPVIIVVAYAISGSQPNNFRFERLAGTEPLLERLDHFSAGRIAQLKEGIRLAQEAPMLGHGFGNYQLARLDPSAHREMEIHNLWLRLLVETGLFLPAIFGGMLVVLLARERRRWRHRSRVTSTPTSQQWIRAAETSVVVAGMALSLFEPNVLLGSFQNSAVWWYSLGALLAHRKEGTVHPDRALWFSG